MEKLDVLPFQVGQLAEAKSFMKGYRSAWFRCKIHEIVVKNGHICHALEYIDFPDEKRKVKISKIYQVQGKQKERQLIVRPQYPCTYDEINLLLVKGITEVTVGIDDVWKVGDLVDWLTDGCFWTGRLTQVLIDGKAELTLLPPPEGEGGVYKVSCKDLRPSLHWSPEYGWRAVNLQEGENCYNYARFIQQLKQANSLSASEKLNSRKIRDMSGVPVSVVPKIRILEDLYMRDSGIEKPSLSDSVSSSHIKCASTETAVHTGTEDLYDSEGASKNIRTGGILPLNIMFSDSLDAVVMDLEELANKIQWLKDILDSELPLCNGMTPSGMTPSWKLVEHRGSSTTK